MRAYVDWPVFAASLTPPRLHTSDGYSKWPDVAPCSFREIPLSLGIYYDWFDW